MAAVRTFAVIVLVFVALMGVPLPVSAHSNDVNADSQLSTDGTVVVETVFILDEGWLVLHADDGGEMGAAIGHTAVDNEEGLQTDVPVRMDRDAWNETDGSRVVHVALHSDDGDGQFDPNDDPVLSTFGHAATERITVERNDRAGVVLAQAFSPATVETNTVTIRNVTLPARGHIVIRNDTEAGPGSVVGSRSLATGAHTNVSVDIDQEFYHARSETFTLVAVAYRDDGDGTFDDADTPVRAGDDLVLTAFGVRKDATTTPHDDGHEDETSHSPSASPTPDRHDTPPSTTETVETTGPGFGVVVMLVALVGAVLLARRRQ